MAKQDPKVTAAFFSWCLETKTAPSPAARAAYDKMLAGDTVPGERKKLDRKHVAVFVYDGEGKATMVTAENTSGKRLEAAFIAAGTIQNPSLVIASSAGAEGVRAVLPDGTIGMCYPIASELDLATGAETSVEDASEQPAAE